LKQAIRRKQNFTFPYRIFSPCRVKYSRISLSSRISVITLLLEPLLIYSTVMWESDYIPHMITQLRFIKKLKIFLVREEA